MNSTQFVSRNGRLILPAEATISIFNPVIYGAFGVYELIQLWQGAIFRLEDHLERLADLARAIDLEPARRPGDNGPLDPRGGGSQPAPGCHLALVCPWVPARKMARRSSSGRSRRASFPLSYFSTA